MDEKNEAIVPVVMPNVDPRLARLNITYNGQQGELPDPVPYDTADEVIKRMVTESVRHGGVPGIDAVPTADFENFVVEKFPAHQDVPYPRIMIRPKAAFGA